MVTIVRKFLIALVLIGGIVIVMITLQPTKKNNSYEADETTDIIELPEPSYTSDITIEEALLTRRSIRQYSEKPLKLSDISQLLWAAQGITNVQGYRTAPSAGALYPLEVYVAAGNVNNLPDGIYRYESRGHTLARIDEGDKRTELSAAASSQYWIKESAAVIVFSAIQKRTTKKYGERGVRYVHMEVGHAAQNVYLQAISLDIGTVVVGAFNDNEVKTIVNMTDEEQPLCIMPVGKWE